MTNALLVKADGETRVVSLPDDNAHELINEYVGGWFDAVRDRERGVVGYVHDEGIILRQRPNVAMSMLFGTLICGDVVLVGMYDPKGREDGESHDVPANLSHPDTVSSFSEMNTLEALIADLEKFRDEQDWSPVVVSMDEWQK